MIELTIDGKKIAVEKGTTILRAAKSNGIYIPNLCYDERLRPYGGCRLCGVEVEGQRKLLAACSTPAENGMVVKTDSPNLRKTRKTVLELLLIHHPLDTPLIALSVTRRANASYRTLLTSTDLLQAGSTENGNTMLKPSIIRSSCAILTDASCAADAYGSAGSIRGSARSILLEEDSIPR